MTMDEAVGSIGRGVVYRPTHGRPEDGTIVAVSSRYVFVRYTGDVGAKATDPADLEFLSPDPPAVTRADG